MKDNTYIFWTKSVLVSGAICLIILLTMLLCLAVKEFMADAGLPVSWFEYVLTVGEIAMLVFAVVLFISIIPVIWSYINDN